MSSNTIQHTNQQEGISRKNLSGTVIVFKLLQLIFFLHFENRGEMKRIRQGLPSLSPPDSFDNTIAVDYNKNLKIVLAYLQICVMC